MKSDIVYCASGDGNVAVEYATHPTKGWRVPLCERCADAMRKLQESFDNDVKN
ncbi:MAG TPA: hypothetical protein VEE85_01430 [Candidatus Bathyarchaeia archaeon]|nr:hypothetical protein [Candidatus Bathyarchaeia archaeon]